MTHVKQSVNGSSILTPDLIEKALDPAMAEFERLNSIRQIDTATCVHGAVRAALQAVIPDLVDEIGKHTPEIQCLRRRVGLIPQEGK